MPPMSHSIGIVATDKQIGIFHDLTSLLRPCTDIFELRLDSEIRFELWTSHQYRTVSSHPNWRTGLLFAGVLINSRTVAFYLMGLQQFPELKKQIAPSLTEYWKGKTTFQFSDRVDTECKALLAVLVEKSRRLYLGNGWIGRR